MTEGLSNPFALFLLQILVILVVTRLTGWLLKKCGQPFVVGEIAAGILLGPSLAGAIWPQFTDTLFPKESLGALSIVSKIGLILFMFVIGIELDAAIVKKKAKLTLSLSLVSILLPFTMGMGLATYLYDQYAPAGAHFSGFIFFIAIAMSITAFPVLARILRERKMDGSRLGIIALTCAAADDVAAWCILAAITALIKAEGLVSILRTLGLSIIYISVMFVVIKPLIRKVISKWSPNEHPDFLIASLLGGLIASAWAAQVIGIHALFGAFLFGLFIPADWPGKAGFIARIEDLAGVLLLPAFFAITGLRTQIGAMQSMNDWIICLAIIVIATAGKLGGGALVARASGERWDDAITLGALMNTRGLMQLVVLNIGYDLGMFSPSLFTMMVVMAIVTTAMTGPILSWMQSRKNVRT